MFSLRKFTVQVAACGLLLCHATPVTALGQNSTADTPALLGLVTNGPAILQLVRMSSTNAPVSANAAANPPRFTIQTNALFTGFLPDSLNHHVWTNFITRTNGRSLTIWEERRHPASWPTNPPVVKWNPNSLINGWRGWTALSPCWEGEGGSGQIPITALTRRHGYTRGHGMGAEGFSTNFLNRKIWFLTSKNELVTVKILRNVVRLGGNPRRDYTIFLFDRDLPAGIEPVGVGTLTNVLAKYIFFPGMPTPFLKTEQSGQVSAELPGWTVPTWKGGDSGSPDLLPLPGELVFVGGRSTSGPTREMQGDMDELCRLQKLDPKRYQMRWTDLTRFPDYGMRTH